ncbi:MAG: alpha/beta hydrolase [Spirochaetia bacterium]
MKTTTFTFTDPDGVDIFVYRWLPEGQAARAAVQVSHGMQEYAGRYTELAEFLTKNGYAVYANDHRGHGRTAFGPEKQGQLGPGGWDSTVKDLKQLTDKIKSELPGIPVFLLGHSWGSFLAQNYIGRWGGGLKGAVLSATHGKDPLVKLGVMLGKRDVKRRGPDAQGGILETLSVGSLNRKFEPARTSKDWLNRDPAEVDKYIADPWCGRHFPNGFYSELTKLLENTWTPRNEARIPADLPLYLFSGTLDPVGKFTKTVTALADRYRRHGIKDVTTRFYEGARHETLHETNKAEVMNDLLAWLNAHCG